MPHPHHQCYFTVRIHSCYSRCSQNIHAVKNERFQDTLGDGMCIECHYNFESFWTYIGKEAVNSEICGSCEEKTSQILLSLWRWWTTFEETTVNRGTHIIIVDQNKLRIRKTIVPGPHGELICNFIFQHSIWKRIFKKGVKQILLQNILLNLSMCIYQKYFWNMLCIYMEYSKITTHILQKYTTRIRRIYYCKHFSFECSVLLVVTYYFWYILWLIPIYSARTTQAINTSKDILARLLECRMRTKSRCKKTHSW